jgi:hypothetical protein
MPNKSRAESASSALAVVWNHASRFNESQIMSEGMFMSCVRNIEDNPFAAGFDRRRKPIPSVPPPAAGPIPYLPTRVIAGL